MSSGISPSLTTSARFFISIGVTDVIGSRVLKLRPGHDGFDVWASDARFTPPPDQGGLDGIVLGSELAHALRAALAQVPGLDPAAVEDVICGCAIPEGAQGLNVARIGAVLAGLISQVAERKEQAEYLGANGTKLNIHPGSGQFKAKPPWIVSAEQVQTTKVYARTVARIDYFDGADDAALLNTSVSGELLPLNAATLRRALWSHPAMTLGVIARIHWQAARLWIKRVRFFRKPEPPEAFVTR